MKKILLSAGVLMIALFAAFQIFKLPPSPQIDSIKNLAISHRGYSSTTPENTIIAIETAAQKGAEAVEIDVGVTSDNEYVLMHDCTIDRTTNGSGRLSEFSFSQINLLSVDIKTDSTGFKVPTMNEALSKAKELNLMVELDIKQDVDAVDFAKQLSQYLSENNLYSKVWVASFWPDKLYEIRKYDPKIVTAFLRHPHPTDNWLFNTILASDLTPKFIGAGLVRPHFDIIKSDPDYISRMKSYGIETNVWVINTEEEHRWLSSVNHNSYSTDCYGEFCEPFFVGGHEHSGLCSD